MQCVEEQLVLKQYLRSEKFGDVECGGFAHSSQMDIEVIFSCGYYVTMRCHLGNKEQSHSWREG